MSDSPLISVVIPVYKVEKYLRECVDSVIAQTYRNLDIVLVDDGSPDNCPAMCDEYAEIDSRIRVIHQKNGGLSAARNAGIRVARGEYITFIDSDDYVSKVYVEQLYTILKDSGAGISSCIYTVSKEKLSSVITGQYRTITPCVAVIEALEFSGIECNAWSKLYSSSIFNGGKNFSYPDGLTFEDFAVMPEIFSYANSIAFINNPLYFYRLRDDSQSRVQFRSNAITDYYTAYDIAIKSAKKNFPSDWPKLSKHFRNNYMQNIMKLIRDISLSPNRKDLPYDEIISDLAGRIKIRDAIGFMFSGAKLPKKLAALMISFMPKLAVKIIERSGKYKPAYK